MKTRLNFEFEKSRAEETIRLLTILKRNIRKNPISGMCACVISLETEGQITVSECVYLLNYIHYNKPIFKVRKKYGYTFYQYIDMLFRGYVSGFWYPPGFKLLRILWLNKEIKKLNKQKENEKESN